MRGGGLRCWSEWRGMPLWLKKIFTTEDTEVHRDAQGKVRRTFNECWFGFPRSLRHSRCESKCNIAAKPRCAPILLCLLLKTRYNLIALIGFRIAPSPSGF